MPAEIQYISPDTLPVLVKGRTVVDDASPSPLAEVAEVAVTAVAAEHGHPFTTRDIATTVTKLVTRTSFATK